MFSIQSSDLSYFLVANQTKLKEIQLSGEQPRFYHYSYDIIKIDFLMLYSDVVEKNLVGDTKTLYCVVFYLCSK